MGMTNSNTNTNTAIAGALFDFAGFLTTIPAERAVTLSACHEAGPIVELLSEWAKKRGLLLDEACVNDWPSALAAPAQAVTPSDATTAVREPCGKIIKILAAIVNSPQSDDQFGNEVLQRDQVMAKVMEIKAQVDAIYKAAPLPIHPYMQSQKAAAAMTATPAQEGELSEQDSGLIEQAASMLDALANDERNRGNYSTAEGAACSAHAVRRLASTLLSADRAARGAAQAAPVVAATWQPIASAPKDGKAILLRSKNGRIADGLWSAANSHAGFWAWAYVHQEPVEWMPKPGSPAARAQEQQP